MSLSLKRSHAGLFLCLQVFRDWGIVSRDVKRCSSYLTLNQYQSCRHLLVSGLKPGSTDHRVSMHDNRGNNDHQTKQSSARTDADEKERLWKLLEKYGTPVKQPIKTAVDVRTYSIIAENDFASENYDAAIKTFELLLNQTIDVEWYPYWQMRLGHCYESRNPPLRDIMRAWRHYECALTKYPQQITLDIMLKVIRSSLTVLEELSMSNRASELCTQVVDPTYNFQNKEKQSNHTTYAIFEHVRLAHLSQRNKESKKVIYHASEALTLYTQERQNGSIVKISTDDDLKTILKWAAEICVGMKEYDAALIYLNKLADVVAKEPEETSYDNRRHPSMRVALNSLLGLVYEERNQSEWIQALIHYHAALYSLRFIIPAATKTEGRLHFHICGIWLKQPNAEALWSGHFRVLEKVHDLNTNNIIIFAPVKILSSYSERAKQYETLAICYNSEYVFNKVGVVSKKWAIGYAIMAMELFKKTSDSAVHLARLQLFNDLINQKYNLQKP